MSPVGARARPQGLLDRNLLVLGVGEAAGRICGFLAMTHLFRVLGPAHYGRVETAVAVMMFCLIAVEFGLPAIGTRDVARDPAAAAGLLRSIPAAQFASACIVLTALVAAVWSLPVDPLLARLLVAFGLGLLLLPFFPYWLFQARGRMAAVAVPKAARYAVFLALSLALVRTPDDLLRLGFAEVAGVAAMAGLGLVACVGGGDRLRIGGPAAIDRALVRSALPVCGSTLIWALRMYLALVYVGGVAGPEAAGFLGAALRIVLVALAMLDVYFASLFPRMSVAAAGSRSGLRHLVGRSLRLLLVPAVVAAAAAPFAGSWGMGVLYGADAAVAGPLLAALLLLVPVITCRAHVRFTLLALDRQTWELRYSVVCVVLLAALLVPLTAAHGAMGAAWAMVISEAAATALGAWVLWPMLRDGPERPGGTTPDRDRSDGP